LMISLTEYPLPVPKLKVSELFFLLNILMILHVRLLG
jgi:hypothetical protein